MRLRRTTELRRISSFAPFTGSKHNLLRGKEDGLFVRVDHELHVRIRLASIGGEAEWQFRYIYMNPRLANLAFIFLEPRQDTVSWNFSSEGLSCCQREDNKQEEKANHGRLSLEGSQ